MKERYKASLLTATRNLGNIFWWWAADWQSNVHSPWPNELTICADINGFQIPVETSCIGPRWCKAKDFFVFCSGKICLVCFHGFFVLLFYISSVSVTQINAQTPITAILSTYLIFCQWNMFIKPRWVCRNMSPPSGFFERVTINFPGLYWNSVNWVTGIGWIK